MLEEARKDNSLERGLMILSGGQDKYGNFLLTIPTNRLEELQQWGFGELSALILHLAKIAKSHKTSKESLPANSQNSLACLADLRNASTDAITQIIESLEATEHHSRGTISAVYFLSPVKKSKSHILKKLLGLKPSKSRPRIPLFKILLFKTIQELHNQIDVSQLTVDFFGTLQYNHTAWMHLYNVVIRCIEDCANVMTKLPSVKDRVDLLHEYETDGQTSNQLQQLLADLIEKYHIIISDSSLPLYLTLSKQTLFLLENPATDSQLSSVHPNLLEGFKLHLRDLYSALNCWNSDLEEAWKTTENRLTLLIKLYKHRERAKEIERKIWEHYHPLLQEHPIVGKTLSQAELYRAHFTTTLYEPAKELLSQATEILEAVQKLKNGAAVTINGAVSGQLTSVAGGSIDISDISSCLTTSIQPFALQLQHLQQLYVNIHIFHLLFEKALSWYKKVLKFIPESLLQRCTLESEHATLDLSAYSLSPTAVESLVFMPTEWLGAVRVFLSRHPPPRPEHIERLDESTPQQVDRKLRAQARSLALRLRLLQRILSSTRLPLRLVTAVVGWKAELFGTPQTEKLPFNHHLSNSSKDKSKPQLDAAQALNDSVPKQPPHKVPEKSSRNKKTLGYEQEESFTLTTGESPASPEAMKSFEKSLQRKIPVRNLLKSKSVEFNFNSSSTDGSVFDYDKAVLGAQQLAMTSESGGVDVKPKAFPRRTRGFSKDVRPISRKEAVKDVLHHEQAFYDPTDLQASQNSDHDYSYLDQRECKTESSNGNDEISFQNQTEPTPEPPESDSGPAARKLSHTMQEEEKQIDKFTPPNVNERFIRLTFTPKEIKQGSESTFKFDEIGKMPYHLENQYQVKNSPTSDFDIIDPYDNLVKRIREISSSDLNNTEKLKRVTALLSDSTLNKSHRPVGNLSSSKHSVSTLDLRPRAQHIDYRTDDYHNERPVDSVLRMKRNLAKSMEELNVICSNTESLPAVSQESNPATGRYVSGSSTLPHSRHAFGTSALPGGRYVSELKILPLYQLPGGETKEINPPKPKRTPVSMSDVEASQSQHRDDQRKNYSWSDQDSFSPSSSWTSNRQDVPLMAANFNTMSDSSSLSANQAPSHLHSRHSQELDSPHTRPSSLSLYSSRNFLSPSFLRPASSMRELNTAVPSLVYSHHQDTDPDSDYLALEDIEMLRTLQEDPLSNQFSKLSSSTDKKYQRRRSNENVKKKDESKPVVEENYSPIRTRFPILFKDLHRDSVSIPDIHVNYLSFLESFDSPEKAGHEEEFRFLQSTNYDRLTIEADHEYLSQEEVADSLRKTQRILEEEENKRQHLDHDISDLSADDEVGEGILRGARGLSNTTSIDNGYGSWASKLVSALSTSSEGPELEADRDRPLADSDLY
ncbi:uncharacterized protein LOC131947172 [Physella acuta]|uniref:uncharacterized protein LOC131947172 n=1 Tax=Physella acuta TaxID=109671 RepID=UPI0027DD1410|nr:uncharacterized protein LOC131947172 [Physella acuta]